MYEVRATDPDGDALTYLWDFGLGGTATARVWGQPHTGGQSAARTSTIRVTDDKGESVSGTVTVMVGSLNGRWLVTDGPLVGGEFVLLQTGRATVTGEYFLPGAGAVERLDGGRINTAAAVSLPLRIGSRSLTFTGTMDTTGRRVAGTVSGAGFNTAPCVLVLQ